MLYIHFIHTITHNTYMWPNGFISFVFFLTDAILYECEGVPT